MDQTNRPLAIRLVDATDPAAAHVGGKAASLVRLHRAGFAVPDAELLTTSFFAPWIETVTAATAWRDVLAHMAGTGTPDYRELDGLCTAVKARASDVDIDGGQRRTLEGVAARAGRGPLAVRSSSPEEDLAGASYAGLYESVLNVAVEDLPDAVRRCFASCFDARILVYKAERKLDLQPRFAALVQRQVVSEVSGVAFSLNPHNNDFDEAVINAAEGLGERLVAGDVDPDRWVVDKVTGKTVESRIATKAAPDAATACLDDARLRTVATTLCTVESLFGCPVDVEWAFADGRLHLLQARPITTYVPLPEEIQTVPGEQRLLYMDPSLGEGITMSGAVSPLSVDLFAQLFDWLGSHVFGPSFLGPDLKQGIVGAAGARVYGNLSHLMHFRDPRQVASEKRFVDTTLAELFATADLERYRVTPPPNLTARRLIPALLKATLRLGPFLRGILRALLRPRAFLAGYRDDLAAFDAQVASIDPELPISELAQRLYAAVGRVSLTASAPAMLVFIYGGTEALMGLIDPASARHRRLVMDMRGGGDELVLDMGLAMYRLAKSLPASAFDDLGALAGRIESRQMPDEFLARWDDFVLRFGCRGPLEMDLANPKYGDDPGVLLRQLANLSIGDTDPVATRAERRLAREAAYAELSAELPQAKRRKLARIHRTIGAFENVREIPKHHFATVNMVLRRRFLGRAGGGSPKGVSTGPRMSSR